MAYKSASVGRVFILRWLTPPEPGDLKSLGREMTSLHEKVGQQLINLSLIPDEITPPDGAVRREMEAFHPTFMDLCESIHVVVAGTGFKHAVFRSIVSAFALASRKRGLVRVHRNVEAAVAEIQELDPQNVGLRSQLVKTGVVDGFN